MAIKFLDEEAPILQRQPEARPSSIVFDDEVIGEDAPVEEAVINEAPLTVPEPLSDKKFLAQKFGIPQILEDAVVGPLAEVARGFATGTSEVYSKLDSVAKFASSVTDTPKINIFDEWSKNAEKLAEDIPETQQNPFNKFVFQAAGSTVPILTEFALVKGGNIAKFATLEAIKEFGDVEDPNLITGSTAIAKGAIKGAGVGVALPVGGKIAMKAGQLLQTGGRAASKAFIKFITGSQKAADDFIANPGNFVTNPFTKTKTRVDVIAEHKSARQAIENKAKAEKEAFNFKLQNEQKAFDNQLKDVKRKLVETHTNIRNNTASNKKESLEGVVSKSRAAIQESNDTLRQNGVNLLDSTLAKYNLLRAEKGAKVGAAIKITAERNPGAVIPHSTVNGRMQKALKESPFNRGKNGLFEPNTAISADNKDVNDLNRLIVEFRSKRSDGGFGIMYLQDLKNAAREKASIATRDGKHELAKMYTQISKDVNPANIISRDKALTSQFKEIGAANKEFSTFVDKYDRAMGSYYKKNSVDEFVPDINKSLNAIARNDTVAIREMKLADMALPVEDRVYPKITKWVSEAENIAQKQKAVVKQIKNRFKAEEVAFNKSSKSAMAKLEEKQGFETLEAKQKGVKKVREYVENKQSEYNAASNKLDELESFYEVQDKLRQFQAGSGGAGILQHLLGFGGVLPVLTGRASAGNLASAAGFFALSPKFATPVIKGGLGAGRQISRAGDAVSNILSNRSLQQVGGTKILRETE